MHGWMDLRYDNHEERGERRGKRPLLYIYSDHRLAVRVPMYNITTVVDCILLVTIASNEPV